MEKPICGCRTPNRPNTSIWLRVGESVEGGGRRGSQIASRDQTAAKGAVSYWGATASNSISPNPYLGNDRILDPIGGPKNGWRQPDSRGAPPTRLRLRPNCVHVRNWRAQLRRCFFRCNTPSIRRSTAPANSPPISLANVLSFGLVATLFAAPKSAKPKSEFG